MAAKYNGQQLSSPQLTLHRRACHLFVFQAAADFYKAIRNLIFLNFLLLPQLAEIVRSVQKLEVVVVGFLFYVGKGEGDKGLPCLISLVWYSESRVVMLKFFLVILSLSDPDKRKSSLNAHKKRCSSHRLGVGFQRCYTICPWKSKMH